MQKNVVDMIDECFRVQNTCCCIVDGSAAATLGIYVRLKQQGRFDQMQHISKKQLLALKK